MLQRHHGMSDPARALIALIGMRRPRDSQIFPTCETRDSAGGSAGLESGSHGALPGIAARQHGALTIEQGQYRPLLCIEQSLEDGLHFIIELETQAQRAEHFG